MSGIEYYGHVLDEAAEEFKKEKALSNHQAQDTKVTCLLLDWRGEDEDEGEAMSMTERGIVFSKVAPQTIVEKTIYFGCKNVPDDLPSFITRLEKDPHDYVGHGLSKEDAEFIIRDFMGGGE